VKKFNPGNMKASEGIRRCTLGLGPEVRKQQPEPTVTASKPEEPKKEPEVVKHLPSQEPKKAEEKSNPIPNMDSFMNSSNMSEKEGDFFSENELRKYEAKKEEGSNYYKLKKNDQAFKAFSQGITMIEEAHPNLSNDIQGYNKKLGVIYTALLGNRALIASMVKKFTVGKDDANKMIKIDQKNNKAYYRRVLNLKGLTDDLE